MSSCGWTGKILEVDLTSGTTTVLDSLPYGPDFIGGRGLAARIAWDQMPFGVSAFDPENRLMFMTGPLGGTLAPTAGGRLEVCGLAPQAYPHEHYTRSSLGGHWGAELKYAGYDGLILHGRARQPVYLWIEDGRVEVLDAQDLWGLDTITTQCQLQVKHGKRIRTVCIGPAGENLVRIAVILSELQNAAGQGGFGAVMGSKNLKAISVRGTGSVRIAYPEEFLAASHHVTGLLSKKVTSPPEQKRPFKACTLACTFSNCGVQVFNDLYAPHQERSYRGGAMCTGIEICSCFDTWEAGFETSCVANRLGVNIYDVMYGYGPFGDHWLESLYDAGYLRDLGLPGGQKPDFRSGRFWSQLITKIAHRQGVGDMLAEGAARTETTLGLQPGSSPHVAHGFTSHWDGRYHWALPFPYWLVSALNWATDTRDPMVFGYAQELIRNWKHGNGPLSMQKVRKVGKRLYGSEQAVAPDSGYECKAQPTIWHENNDCVKDSLAVCSLNFPFTYSVEHPHGFGDTGAEALLFSTATGVRANEAALQMAGDRIFTLERAIQVREGRSCKQDAQVIPYFEKPDQGGVRLDPSQFGSLLADFYRLRGWDPVTGAPTAQKLTQLGLEFAAR